MARHRYRVQFIVDGADTQIPVKFDSSRFSTPLEQAYQVLKTILISKGCFGKVDIKHVKTVMIPNFHYNANLYQKNCIDYKRTL